MWKRPWGYVEGWAICAGLFLTGSILQYTTGKIDVNIYRFPANLIAGISFLLFISIIYVTGLRKPSLRWFGGLEAGITSLASLLGMIILMGLTRQINPAVDLSAAGGFARLGFMQMTVSWPFILLFLYFLMVLGLVTIRRISHFRWKVTGFILNHAGLFIALLGAILGSGDLQRLRMTVAQDTSEWRATDEKNEMVELPLAIELHSFTIDEYPPKLMILDNRNGTPLPEGQPAQFVVEEIPEKGRLLDWELEVTDLLPYAASFHQQDTTFFVEFLSIGATSAVYVKGHNLRNGDRKEGWVSSGNHMFPYASLRLDDHHSLIMPEREPRRFASEVTVYTQSGKIQEETIEVNRPLRIEGWKIYQLSYDEQMGKWSRISVFELVKDPWLPVVYTGICMMLAGALFLFISAPKKRD